MVTFPYKIIRRRGFASNASISVSEKGVVVRAPFWMPKAILDSFVREKRDWIEKNLQKIEKNTVKKSYTDGEKHLYFGNEYSLKIVPNPIPSSTKVAIVDEYLQVEIYSNISDSNPSQKVRDALLHWYLEQGIGVITQKVNRYSSQIGVEYKKITLKKVSSIWGSCSPQNCLSFNRKLIMAPHEVVDYVIIHEVAHMVHRNHSRQFWGLVSVHDPEYKKHRQWLKNNHHLLTI